MDLEVSNETKNHKQTVKSSRKTFVSSMRISNRTHLQEVLRAQVSISEGSARTAKEDPSVVGCCAYLRNVRLWHSDLL
jgi:hypothetical protein